MVSTEIKSVLKKIGIDPKIVATRCDFPLRRRNERGNARYRAKVQLSVTPRAIEVVINDEGKGIPDINLAMQEGFSTSTEEQRAMGFGAGMELPNIKRNADDLKVSSMVGKGTILVMRFVI